MAYEPADSPLHRLLSSGTPYRLPSGQVVHALEDRSMMNLIKSGYIKRYRITNEGNKSIQLIYGPGDIFPLTPIFRLLYGTPGYRGPETYYYESMTDIEVHSLSLEQLQAAVQRDPAFYRDLLYAAGTRLNTYIHRMEDISLRSSYWRLAYLLVYLAEQFGNRQGSAVYIPVPLTHQVLADVLDLSRETVTREVNKLRERGLVEGSKYLTIPDVAALKKIYM